MTYAPILACSMSSRRSIMLAAYMRCYMLPAIVKRGSTYVGLEFAIVYPQSGSLIFIEPDTILAKILSSYSSSSWDNMKLHETPDLKKVYHQFSTVGDSKPPELGEMVDFHYTCFIKVDERLVELNGDLEGPVELGALGVDDDLLSENAVALIRRYMDAEDANGIGFNIMALCPA